MTSSQPAVYAFVITALVVVGSVVLIAMNKTVPDQLYLIGGGAGLGGLGALKPGA